MTLQRSAHFYRFTLCALMALALTACKTKPMYTEGDVHFELTCVEADATVCEQGLREACAKYEGEVVAVEVRRERYVSEALKAALRSQGIQAQSVHVICRPPAKEQEDIARQGSTHPDNSAAAQRDNLSGPLNLDPNAKNDPDEAP